MADAEIDLLRRLAGRVEDDALSGFRDYLGAGETTMMGDSLVGYLSRMEVPLTDAEHELLVAVADADPEELARIPRVGEVPKRYEFDSGTGVSAPIEVDRRLVGWLTELPAARRLLRAYRRPVDHLAAGQATWLYLVELAPDGEVAAVQSQVPIGDATHGVVEVYTVGEQLPSYHVEAFHAARAVWSRDT